MICDRMLQSIAMLQWKPSVQAAASLYLAREDPGAYRQPKFTQIDC